MRKDILCLRVMLYAEELGGLSVYWRVRVRRV